MEFPEIPDRLFRDGPLIPECSPVECAALGVMVMDAEALDYGLKVLSPRMILNGFNRRVFVAMMQLRRRQIADPRLVVIGPVEIAQQLGRTGWPAGKAFTYMTGLVSFATGYDNYKCYIDTVKETSQLRGFYALGEFVAAAEQTRHSALQPDANPAHIAACVRQAVDAIERDGYADLRAIFERNK